MLTNRTGEQGTGCRKIRYEKCFRAIGMNQNVLVELIIDAYVGIFSNSFSTTGNTDFTSAIF